MKLRDWLRERHITEAQFAVRIGCNPNTVQKWVVGRHTPHPPIVRRILRVTRGEVRPADLLRRKPWS
jgi:DNA-binding transcriptional regulator YdaS (Cro superfamily)